MSREWIRAVVKVLALGLTLMAPVLMLTAQTKPAAAEEPLYGTWVNEQFGTGTGNPQKCVYFADGRELDYMMAADKEPWMENKLKVEDQWRDEDGNYWYKLSWTSWYYGYSSGEIYKGYSLVKVSASGSTLEGVAAESRIPDAEDWSLIPHPAYYRQP